MQPFFCNAFQTFTDTCIPYQQRPKGRRLRIFTIQVIQGQNDDDTAYLKEI